MAPQHVALLYSEPPALNKQRLLARVATFTGQDVQWGDATEPLVLFHPAFMAAHEGGDVPAQTVIVGSTAPSPVGEYGDLVQQSWATEDAAGLVAQATCEIKVLELMASPLDPNLRLALFHAVVRALAEQTSPIAIAFEHSQQVLRTSDALDDWSSAPDARPGCVNVRYHNPGDGSQLMDTRGLEEIGLHDLQCHYKVLDPGPVAHLLTSLAHYLIEHGPVIDSGHTIAGIEQGQRWTCRFEESLVQPKRTLLDIHPGPEFAGGKRDL